MSRIELPAWIKQHRLSLDDKEVLAIKRLLREKGLHSVCEEARCPNIKECFSQKKATFMILGNQCTRSCRFCAVEKCPLSSWQKQPLPVNNQEPHNVALTVKELNLNYVVITSPSRDDLGDGGADFFRQTIFEIKKINPGIKIEVLIPDFGGSFAALAKIVEVVPFVINHNLETVSRLYSLVRPQADYQRSLGLLRNIKKIDCSIYPVRKDTAYKSKKDKSDSEGVSKFSNGVYTKSGMMLGLGEQLEEIISAMKDLRDADCDFLTLGQYLMPSKDHLEVKKYITPAEFENYKKIAEQLGFRGVASGPFVRSSYQAEELCRF